MVSSYLARARVRVAMGLCFSLALAGAAAADTVTLTAVKNAYGTDGGMNADPYLDGTYNYVYSGTHVYVVRQISTNPYSERDQRSALDFVLPAALLQPNVVINSATLSLTSAGETVSSPNTLTIHGIPSTSAAFMGVDLAMNNPIVTVPLTAQPCCSYAPRTFQVKSWVQHRRDGSFGRAAFMLAPGTVWGTHLSIHSNATLTIDWSIAIGAVPTLAILAPSSGSTGLQGDPVTFEAISDDAENGNIAASIQWSSSRDGALGNGSPLTTASLTTGNHIITASVTDSDGNTVSKTVSLQIFPATNTVPTVSLIAPAENAVFTQGAAITFQASASDVEDGNLSSTIAWSSNLNGSLGTGASVSRSNLSLGAHQIVASVTDSQGNTGSAVRNIVVEAPANTAPTVSIASPSNGATLSAGVSFTLSGSANDTQQGNMSSSLQWLLNGSVIATGGSASATISNPGSHTITARVTDGGGLTGSQSVTVTVASAPADYCALRSNSASYEYIAGVRSGALNNTSGANINGYHNFTGVTFQWPVGSNPITLTPGFGSGSYPERWAVYLDLNRDKAFTSNERLYTGMSASSISTNLSIPAGTATGPTRMRVVMSYGTDAPLCGSFSYGEVEDYTVNVLAAGTPPPGLPTYCSSRGTSSSQEWIQYFMTNNNTSRPTGNDGGYRDYTADWPISLPRGGNSIATFPFFAGGVAQPEFWNVWIDYNADGAFAPEELVSSFSSSGSQGNGTFVVPASLNPGLKVRMRLQMKRGTPPTSACETFANGEVEDHTVQIQ